MKMLLPPKPHPAGRSIASEATTTEKGRKTGEIKFTSIEDSVSGMNKLRRKCDKKTEKFRTKLYQHQPTKALDWTDKMARIIDRSRAVSVSVVRSYDGDVSRGVLMLLLLLALD